MQFTKLVVAAAAFAFASAQTVKFTNTNFAGITVGTPFNITWAGASSDITLKLKNGPSTAQLLVETIGSGLSGTSYSWTPESTLVDGTYNLEIDHGSDPPNYSIQFTISGGLVSSASASSATSGSASSVTSTVSSATTTLTTTASNTSSASSGSSTSKTASSTTKPSSSSTAASTAATTVPAANNAAQYASPFAFVLMSFVAIAALN